jgi:uncharacterized metal-binding protein YceD (DUF177 family)
MTGQGTGREAGVISGLRRQNRVAIPFTLEPDADARRAAAARLGIDAVRKLRFEGTLAPEGTRDWRLEARLGATVVQPCVVTLAPVTTRIDTVVLRAYLADFVEPEEDEAEMPEDETQEPLPDRLDLADVMLEALALALPDYPRAEGAELGGAAFAEPGVKPITDEDARPLAGLAALRDLLREGPGGDGGAPDGGNGGDGPEGDGPKGRDDGDGKA